MKRQSFGKRKALVLSESRDGINGAFIHIKAAHDRADTLVPAKRPYQIRHLLARKGEGGGLCVFKEVLFPVYRSDLCYLVKECGIVLVSYLKLTRVCKSLTDQRLAEISAEHSRAGVLCALGTLARGVLVLSSRRGHREVLQTRRLLASLLVKAGERLCRGIYRQSIRNGLRSENIRHRAE